MDLARRRRRRRRRQPDEIARLCIEQYNALGKGGAKPRVRTDGRHEWTVLAGVVLESDGSTACIALATGVKAQPLSSLSIHGDVLHDCHAEVLCRRAARSWLLSRLLHEVRQPPDDDDDDDVDDDDAVSPRIFEARSDAWRLRDDVRFHLYCSTVPCGDASSSLVQQRTQAEPSSSEVLRGRAHSSTDRLHLRTKPGRPDSEPSISMSCTDKIAAWSLLGFQGSLLSRWIGKVTLASVVIGDEALPPSALDRVERRVFAKKTAGEGVQVVFANASFPDSRQEAQRRLLAARPDACIVGPSDELDIVPSAASLVWSLGGKAGGIVDGRRQGSSGRRTVGEPLRGTSRSSLCKLDWFRAISAASSQLASVVPSSTYHLAKHDVEQYRQMKWALRGTANVAAADRLARERRQVSLFTSRVAKDPADQETAHDHTAPFFGWLVAGQRWESFDVEGHTM